MKVQGFTCIGDWMPKLHEREAIVREAKLKLSEAVQEWGKGQDLTQFEYIQVVQSVLGEAVMSTCRYGIRVERHGDPEKPSGLA